VHAGRIQAAMAAESRSFARINCLTLRDDAPPAIMEQRSGELRDLISGIAGRGHESLVLPVLLTQDGIETGLLRRLENHQFRYRGGDDRPASAAGGLDC
jgi:hypothetical protein